MAHTSIHAAAKRPDLNPAALFQATPNPEPSGNASFEAALDRAREPERPEPSQSAQPRRNERSNEPARAQESPPQQAERPQEASTERPAEAAPTREGEASAKNDTPAGQGGKQAASEEETPAALPAEIAAILAALAVATGRGVRPVDGEAPDAALSPLLADAGKGKGGNAAQGNTPQLILPGAAGKDSGELPIAVASRDSTVQQAVALATQAAPGRSFADQVLAGLRGESSPGLQGAGLPFAARETSQQIQQLTQLPVNTAAGQRGWATEIGNQVSWMLGRNESKAELVLTPPSLGKLGVSIQVNGDQTTAHFVAATQAARDALEQAMPRLREVLQQAGINLGQTNVSTSGDQRAHDGGAGNEQRGGWGRQDGAEAGTAGAATTTAASSWVRSGNGVIDTFA